MNRIERIAKKLVGSSYPNMNEVEKANLWQLVYWNRYLPGPGTDYMGEDRFEQEMKKEAKIISRIVDRIKELGWITPNISKSVGWDR